MVRCRNAESCLETPRRRCRSVSVWVRVAACRLTVFCRNRGHVEIGAPAGERRVLKYDCLLRHDVLVLVLAPAPAILCARQLRVDRYDRSLAVWGSVLALEKACESRETKVHTRCPGRRKG